MANRSTRVLLMSSLLVVAIAVGYLLHPKASLARSWNIRVGPKPCDLIDEDHVPNKATLQEISVSNRDSIKWRAPTPPGNQNIYIILHIKVTPDCPLPFEGLTDLKSQDQQGRGLYLIGSAPSKKVESGPVGSRGRRPEAEQAGDEKN